MITQPLKYINYSIVFQEVPNEITLALNISGCPIRCENCHSKYLWEYQGNELMPDISKLINKYKPYITCICFMGGNQNIDELSELCDICHFYNLKTCLYTGYSLDEDLKQFALSKLDYLKVGKYIQELGGLANPNTNQKMYKILNDKLIDITSEFWKEGVVS